MNDDQLVRKLASDPRFLLESWKMARDELAKLTFEVNLYRLIVGDISRALEKYPPEEVRLQVLKNILGTDHPFVREGQE